MMFRHITNFLYNYLVRTNLFISLCAVAFYFSGLLVLTSSKIYFFSWETLLIFCSTLLIYNVSQSKFGIAHYIKFRSAKSIVFFLMALIPVAVLVWNLQFTTLLYFAHLGLISVLYNSPLLNSIKYLPLRSIPLVKIFLISYIWANIGSFLPVLTHYISPNREVYMFFVAQFLFILAITLPFDIRDFYGDIRKNLRTLPGTLGIKRTKYLAYLALVSHFVLLMFVHDEAWIFIPLLLMAFFLAKRSTASKPGHYYTFYIDGLIILQFLTLFIYRQL